MPAIALYLLVTAALIITWHRCIQRLSLGAAIVLVLLPFCFTGRALLTGRIYAPIDMPFMAEPLDDHARDFGIEAIHNGTLSDLYSQIIPWQHTVRAAMAQGEWPLWNPFILCGTVLAANMQSAPYDAISVIGVLLPQPQALTFGAAMTFFLAGFFSFAFARALGCGETASLVAGAGYMFGGMLAFFIEWPLGRAWTFLPLVLFAVRRVVRERNLRGAALLTVALVLTIFAGHPESVLHITARGAAWGVFELLDTRQGAPRAIGLAVASGVVALLLTAIALLPFMAAAPQTKEYAGRRLFASSSHISSGDVVKRAARTFFPFYGGQPERGNWTSLWEPTSARVGSLILGLALTALVAARRKETWFFLGLSLVALCAAWDAPPIAPLLHALPLFDIALNERLAFAAAFAMSILAALAVDAWAIRQPRAAAAPLVIVAVGLGIGITLLRESQIAAGVDPWLIAGHTLAELVPLALVAILFVLRTPPRFALPAILGLVLIQRTFEDGSIYPTLPDEVFYPRTPLLQAIPHHEEPFRVVPLHYALTPAGSAMYGLEDPRGYEAMTFRRLTETYPIWSLPQPVHFNVVHEMWRPFLSFLNVRYAIASLETEPAPGWRVVATDRGSRLLENTRVLPRAFIPKWIRYEQESGPILKAMAETEDFGHVAWIEEPEYKPHERTNGPGTVSIRRKAHGEYAIDAVMELDSWVVVSDSAWPGWRVYIDGRRVQPHPANHAFLGIYVPAGKHHVRLVYRPEAFTRGRNISVATIVVLAVFLGVRWHRHRSGRAGRKLQSFKATTL